MSINLVKRSGIKRSVCCGQRGGSVTRDGLEIHDPCEGPDDGSNATGERSHDREEQPEADEFAASDAGQAAGDQADGWSKEEPENEEGHLLAFGKLTLEEVESLFVLVFAGLAAS